MVNPRSRLTNIALMSMFLGGALTVGFSANAADDRPAALKKGIAALSSGAHETATALLDDVIKSNNRSKEHLAYAFLYRAKAYLAMGRPTRALSDIDSALWLDGLPAKARTQAVQIKQKALEGSGQKASATAPVRHISPTRQTLAYTAPAKSATPVKREPAPRATNPSGPTAAAPIQPWTTRALAAKPTARREVGKRTAAVTSTAPKLAPWVTRATAAPAPKAPARTAPVVKPRVVRAPLPLPPAANTPPVKTTAAPKKPGTPPQDFKTTTTRAPGATPPATTSSVNVPVVATPPKPVQPGPTDVELTTRVAPADELPSQTATSDNQQQPSPQLQLSLVPGLDTVAELTGLAQKEDAPVAAMRRAAEDAARQRRERIRRHNEARAAAANAGSESANTP